MAKEKVVLVALPVVNLMYLRLYPLTHTIATVLGILIADFGENIETLVIYKLH
jgi:hypothetical protein